MTPEEIEEENRTNNQNNTSRSAQPNANGDYEEPAVEEPLDTPDEYSSD